MVLTSTIPEVLLSNGVVNVLCNKLLLMDRAMQNNSQLIEAILSLIGSVACHAFLLVQNFWFSNECIQRTSKLHWISVLPRQFMNISSMFIISCKDLNIQTVWIRHFQFQNFHRISKTYFYILSIFNNILIAFPFGWGRNMAEQSIINTITSYIEKNFLVGSIQQKSQNSLVPQASYSNFQIASNGKNIYFLQVL